MPDIVNIVLSGTLDQLKAERDKLDKAIEYLEKLTTKLANVTEPEIPSDKRCEKCAEVKSSDDFFRDKRTADGLSRVCRNCRGNKSV